MGKNLVIVESPAKGKTIEKFLGKDYKVVASMGHFRDLPHNELGIDIEKGFKAKYVISDTKKKTVENLKKLKKTYSNIWIATDEDREGEAIGWHLCHILDLDPKEAKRIAFHEITKEAILDSIKNPKNINLDLVNAQQARRLLDRLVGYKVSPILWKKIRKGLSAGRVQSVAVKLIVEKEREIKDFKPTESWKIGTWIKYENKEFRIFFSKLDNKIKNFKSEEDVKKFFHILFNDEKFNIEEKKDNKGNKIFNISNKKDFILNSIEKKDGKKTPQAPFTTSTLQQEASRKFSFSVKQTMTLAQKLYEGVDLGTQERVGLITYMRTDSVNLSTNAINQAKNLITKNYGKEYLKVRKYKTKTSGAQEAHEAIRPTNLSRIPKSLEGILDPRELKLYTLIWNRTIASQMSDAIIEITKFSFSPVNHTNQEWITKGEVLKFDGFMKLYVEGTDDEEENDNNLILPNIKKGTLVESNKTFSNQIFSRPPSRYTEASLVKKLESEGIGRPSTYAPTISTIIDRGYIEKFEKKYLIPTDIAYTVNDFLEKYFINMMNYNFTKNIEEEFDKIANGKEKYDNMLKTFWEKSLKTEIDNATSNAEKIVEKVGEKCPKCKTGDLIYKYSKGGKFIGCSGYPDCDYIQKPKEELLMLEFLRKKYEGKPCPVGIEGTIVVKIGRFGPFLASSEYPKVKWIGKIKSEKDEILEEILKEKGLLIDEATGEEMVVKNSKRGQFLAAKNYPNVKIAKNIPKDVWDELKNRLEEKEEEKKEV